MESLPSGGPLLIVMNAASGHNATEDAQATMARVFREAGRAHEFLLLDDPSRIAETAKRAVERAIAQRGVVVAAGGDGTINAVAQAVLGTGCVFGILPQGTYNYFGRAHGVSQDTEASARAMLGAEVQAVQVGLVNDRAFLVNCSLGLYPRLLEDREAHKHRFGRSRTVAMVSGLLALMRHRAQLELEIELEGQTHRVRTPTLFVGNNKLQLDRIGIAEGTLIERDRLVAVLLKPVSSAAMVGLMLRGAIGSLGEAERVTSFAFRKLTVWPRGARRIRVATDGEVHAMRTPLVFRAAPHALHLLVPVEKDREDVK